MKSIRYDGPGGLLSELELWEREQRGDNSEELRRLRRKLRDACADELTPRQAELLRLRFEKRLTIREIAQQTGVAPSTVSRTLHRGLTRLRRCLRYGL